MFVDTLALVSLNLDEPETEQLLVARRAWRKYGKGRHPAGLNLGDCASYALSKVTGEAMLFKGNDFPRTDVEFAA